MKLIFCSELIRGRFERSFRITNVLSVHGSHEITVHDHNNFSYRIAFSFRIAYYMRDLFRSGGAVIFLSSLNGQV